MTAAITGVTGFDGTNHYEAPVGKMLGAAAGFVAAVLVEPFAFLDQQGVFANTDGATRGWRILLNSTTIEATVWNSAPGQIQATHVLTAGDLGRLLLVVLLFDGTNLQLIVNGSLVATTPLPAGKVYLPATTQATLGAGAGGVGFMGAVVGAAYSDGVPPFIQQLRGHWLVCQSSRDMVDGALGSLFGPLVVPTFEHLYSARRSNNGGPGALPPTGFPFLLAGNTWPDDRGTGGAVDFTKIGVTSPFVITTRDGI